MKLARERLPASISRSLGITWNREEEPVIRCGGKHGKNAPTASRIKTSAAGRNSRAISKGEGTFFRLPAWFSDRRLLCVVRSPALCAALFAALCCCPIAAAQDIGRPRVQGALIDDLDAKGKAKGKAIVLPAPGGVIQFEALENAAEIQQAPPKSAFAQFSARLDRELNFVARVCKLSPEERKSLETVRGEIIGQFKPLLERAGGGQAGAGQAGNAPPGGGVQRMAAVNGQVVVINPAGVAEFVIPDRILHAQVDLAVNASLSKQQLATLEAERKRLEQQMQQAHVLALLAAIDEAMLLSDEQAQRLRAYLEANWRPVWGQVVSGGQLSASGATPLQTAKMRGLGGVFDLFDADLEPLLNPVQIAAWREMRTLRLDVRIVAQPPADRRAIVLRRIRVAPGPAIAEGEAAAPQAVVQVPVQRAQPAAGGRPLAEQAAATADQPPIIHSPKELSLLLELLVADVDAATQLSPQQRETLLLAGKLDMLHYRNQREEQAREALERADEAPGNQRRRVQTESVAAANPFAEENSRFRKALASRLSAEQLAKLAADERRRWELRRAAALQSLAAEFSEAAKMTSAQHDALAAELAAALDERLPPDGAETLQADSQSMALACILNLGRLELRPLVEEDQWDAVERKLVELSQIAIRAEAIRRQREATHKPGT